MRDDGKISVCVKYGTPIEHVESENDIDLLFDVSETTGPIVYEYKNSLCGGDMTVYDDYKPISTVILRNTAVGGHLVVPHNVDVYLEGTSAAVRVKRMRTALSADLPEGRTFVVRDRREDDVN